MLGFMAYLILRGYFKGGIVLSFLPVGHTHEDIDQFFSRLATYLLAHNAISRLDLAYAIRQAYQMKGTATFSLTHHC